MNNEYWAAAANEAEQEKLTEANLNYLGIVASRKACKERNESYCFCEECTPQKPFQEPNDNEEALISHHFKQLVCGEKGHDWDSDFEGFVFCAECSLPHPGNINPEIDSPSLQDARPDLFNPNGTRRGDY